MENEKLTKNNKGGESLPLATAGTPASATPSAGASPATPPVLSHGFDFANAKSITIIGG